MKKQSVIFRLTDLEKDFLREIGNGNMQKGLTKLIADAGFDQGPIVTKNKFVVRRESAFDKEEYNFKLLKNGKEISSLTIKFDIARKLLSKIGGEAFYNEVVLDSLLRTGDVAREEIKDIIDLDTGKIIWQDGKNATSDIVQEYLELFDGVLRIMRSTDKTPKGTTQGKIEYLFDSMVKLAKNEPKLTPQSENIKYYQNVWNQYFRNETSPHIRNELITQLSSERDALEEFAIKHEL